MFTRPDDLTDADVAAVLAEGWLLGAEQVEYAAVGYGSHHWRVTANSVRWFVSVDDLDARRRGATETREHARSRLSAALRVARSLRDAGIDFVVAPTPNLATDVLQPISDRYVLALYPHVDGEAHQWGPYPTRQDRLAVLDRVVAVHGVSPSIAESALLDDFAIPSRDQLVVAVTDPNVAWGPGPYARQAKQLLDRHRDWLGRALTHYDELATHVLDHPRQLVLTHGEPHRGNTINTAGGVVLIDWDTALLAPPERDLWALIDEDPEIALDYTQRTGVAVDDLAVRLYRLWWDLCEIALFVDGFRQPHDDTDDMSVAWQGLALHLDPTRWNGI